jgi:hypothetical protein
MSVQCLLTHLNMAFDEVVVLADGHLTDFVYQNDRNEMHGQHERLR